MATTYVQVNGEWVTRTIDEQQLLDRNRERDQPSNSRMEGSELLLATPKVGLLSRTIIRSPLINHILSAFLRSENQSDVVFVGEDFIHVKEFRADTLHHVATKADFGCRIWAAKVLGVPPHRKRNTDTLSDLALKPDEGVLGFEKEKLENDPMELDEHADRLPPQILMLTLETQELMFLFLRQAPDGKATLRTINVPYQTPADHLEALGKCIASHPYGKAVAVGASEGVLILSKVKDWYTLRENRVKGVQDWCPISSQLQVKIDGVVLLMDFLFLDHPHEDAIILVLVVSRRGYIRIVIHGWESSDDLNRQPEVSVEQLSERKYQTPLMLIPLGKSRDFLLICEHGALLFQNTLTTSVSNTPIRLPTHLPIHPGSSPRLPLWTSWTRPTVHANSIFMVREDGILVSFNAKAVAGPHTSSIWRYIAVKPLDPNQEKYGVEYSSPVHLDWVDNWARTLDIAITDQQQQHLLITSGRQPYGSLTELFSGLQARTKTLELQGQGVATKIWTFPNPATNDIIILLSFPTHTRILASTRDLVEFGELANPAIDADQSTIAANVFFGEYLVQFGSAACYISRIATENSETRIVPFRTIQLSLQPVLVASSRTENLVALVLYGQGTYWLDIWVVRGDDEGAPLIAKSGEKPLAKYWDKLDSLTCVATSLIFGRFYVILAVTGGLLIMLVDANRAEQDMTVLLNDVDYLHLGNTGIVESIAVVSALGHYNDNPNDAPHLLLLGFRNGYLGYIHLVDTVRGNERKGKRCLKFGVRRLSSGRTVHGKLCTLRIGSTTVQITPRESSSPCVALITCDSDVLAVFLEASEPLRIRVCQIYLTDHETGALLSANISSPACMLEKRESDTQDVEDSVLLACQDGCYIASFNPEQTVVTRRLQVQSTPARTLFCPWVNRYLVAGVRVDVPDPVPGGWYRQPKRRTPRSVLELVCLNPKRESDISSRGSLRQNETSTRDDVDSASTIELLPGEQVYAMVPWSVEYRGGRHDMIIVGTGRSSSAGIPPGRLLFVSTARSARDTVKLKITKGTSERDMVTAVASYDAHHIFCCVGTSLKVYRISFGSDGKGRFSHVASRQMSSRIIYITTKEPFVYVSTAEDSVLALFVEQWEDHFNIIDIGTDSGARNGQSHLSVEFQTRREGLADISSPAASLASPTENLTRHPAALLLASDKNNTLIGLHQRFALRYESQNATISPEVVCARSRKLPLCFTATLPRSIMRLHHSPRFRRPWKPQAKDIPGVAVNEIVGVAADGTIMNFTVLSENALNLLSFIRDLFTTWISSRKESPYHDRSAHEKALFAAQLEEALKGLVPAFGAPVVEMQTDNDQTRIRQHIDGDILSYIFEYGGIELIKHLIGEESNCEDKSFDDFSGVPPPSIHPHQTSDDLENMDRMSGPTKDRRMEVLTALVRDLAKELEDEEQANEWLADPIKAATGYLKDILEPIL
ncbi:MAG: hypothetical protein M1820_005172 [Bogoriella megaspora]|nr:MAG: hypothetical protein M1820_005172 [Bogoriella megaspora]